MTSNSHRRLCLAPLNKSSDCQGGEPTLLKAENGIVGPADRNASWVGSFAIRWGSIVGERKRTHSWAFLALWGPDTPRQHMKF